MFSQKETSLLKKQLDAYIKKSRDWLEQQTEESPQRDRIEDRLITSVSIINKLEHAQPELETKSPEVKLLIVEDNDSIRRVLRHYFMECGFKNVELAEDGARALQMMKKSFENDKPYSLVISDWEMPKLSGIELLKKVRTDAQLWRTPFYLLTSLSDKKYIVESINLGVTGYMTKPVNQNMITEKFKDYLKAK